MNKHIERKERVRYQTGWSPESCPKVVTIPRGKIPKRVSHSSELKLSTRMITKWWVKIERKNLVQRSKKKDCPRRLTILLRTMVSDSVGLKRGN